MKALLRFVIDHSLLSTNLPESIDPALVGSLEYELRVVETLSLLVTRRRA